LEASFKIIHEHCLKIFVTYKLLFRGIIINTPKIGHYFEYTALRFAETVINFIPRFLALRLGAFVGQIICFCGVYRKIVQKNFDHVGIWNHNQTKRIIPELYRNIGRYATDFLRNGALPPWRVHDFHLVDEASARGKGTVVVLAHFGNWELLAAIFGSKVNNLNVIAKPMQNPLVERWLYKKRTGSSVKTIYTKNALRGMLDALRKNGITAILIDQHMRAMGTPVLFLGKTASTVRTVAGLVRKTGSTVMPVYALLDENGSYDICISVAESPISEGSDEENIINMIQIQHNDIISQWIKEHPAHWFGWFHKRFKGYVDYNL
jgi:KDO2-lipid IV(A) lauroyltransferase